MFIRCDKPQLLGGIVRYKYCKLYFGKYSDFMPSSTSEVPPAWARIPHKHYTLNLRLCGQNTFKHMYIANCLDFSTQEHLTRAVKRPKSKQGTVRNTTNLNTSFHGKRKNELLRQKLNS